MSRAILGRPAVSAALVRKTLWVLLCAFAVAMSAFAVASAANFASIVGAKASVYIVPRFEVSYEGLDAQGRLEPSGSVTVLVTAVIENPSDRTLRIQTFAYSGWMRDVPAEKGLNESRRIADDLLISQSGEMRFFRMFGQSSEVALDPVPPRGNRTFTFPLTVSAGNNPARFIAARNITDYAVATGGAAASVLWNHYLYLVLVIDGVPEATSPSAPAHLRDIRRIEREVGVNIAIR